MWRNVCGRQPRERVTFRQRECLTGSKNSFRINLNLIQYVTIICRAVPWLRRQSPASDRKGLSSFSSQFVWDLWWTKWNDGRSPLSSTSVSPANSHCSKSSIIIYYPGLSTVAQTVADVPSGLILTPSQGGKKKNK
jgi:hypothetical protein